MEGEVLWEGLRVSSGSVRHAGPLRPSAPPAEVGRGGCAFSPLHLHLLKIFVGRVFVTVVLHLVQVTLFRGEHWVDLEEHRLCITAGPLEKDTALRRPELFAVQSPRDRNQPSVPFPLGEPKGPMGKTKTGRERRGGSKRQHF